MVGVFFSVLRKCNLGRLFLRPDMVFFVCYCGCVCCEKLFLEISVLFVLLIMNCGLF